MLKDLKLSYKIGLTFSAIFLIMSILGIINIFNMNSNKKNLEKIVNGYIPETKLSTYIEGHYLEAMLDIEDYIHSLNKDSLKKATKKLDEVKSIIVEEKVVLTKQNYLEKLKSNISIIEKQIDEYQNLINNMNNQEIIGQNNKNDIETIKDSLMTTLREISASGFSNVLETTNDYLDNSDGITGFTMIGLLISLIVSMTVAFLILFNITKPINKMAKGLADGTEQVTSASEQFALASQRLAEANIQQVSSIEITSTTLEQSALMIKQSNENTKQAATLANNAKVAAVKGNLEMEEMSKFMDEIKRSSDRIAKIIKVIDDIAFQTNILALNAAVEAARAGEAGMGFAIVAEEVRNLAQRSAKAAKDTGNIIENNIEISNKGVEMSKRVKESLEEITSKSKKVNDLMDEIAVASQEQSQGILQMSQAMLQIEKITQENAATAQESAATSEELTAQAETLKDIVEKLLVLLIGKKKGSLFINKSIEKKPHNFAICLEEKIFSDKKLASPKKVNHLSDNDDF